MRCKKAEKYLLNSFDNRIDKEKKDELKGHLENCPSCQTKKLEYRSLLKILKNETFPDPQPYFWDRLRPKLDAQNKSGSWALWKQWGIRAIPLSMLVIVLLTAALTLFYPPQTQELSHSEILLRDQNPFQETMPILREEGEENPNMLLIFTSVEEYNGIRRYFP